MTDPNTPTVTLTVETSAPFRGNVRTDQRPVQVLGDDGGRAYYMPHHVGESVMTEDGYAEVVDVDDHECGGDWCPVVEIDLPDYTDAR